MIDETFDRDYRHSRSELNAALAKGVKTLRRSVSDAFEALNRIEYAAPWTNRKKAARCN